jgi:hypothetical protein
MKFHAILLIAATTIPCAAQAQSDGSAPLILELPASTRALGLGDVFVLSTATSDGLFYNPGLVNAARGFGADVQRYRSASTLATVSAATALGSGGVAVGVQMLSFSTTGPTALFTPDDAGDLLLSGGTAASELVATVGYGRVIAGFRVGAAGKVIEQRIGADRDATAAVDVGIVRRFFGITFGLTGQNLGPGLTTGGFTDAVALPSGVTLGASTSSRPVGPLDVTATAAVSRRRDGEIIPAGGVEISWWPVIGRTFTGRVGFRRVPDDSASPVTVGLGFTGDSFTIEYGFEGFDGPGAAHRFGIRWR